MAVQDDNRYLCGEAIHKGCTSHFGRIFGRCMGLQRLDFIAINSIHTINTHHPTNSSTRLESSFPPPESDTTTNVSKSNVILEVHEHVCPQKVDGGAQISQS